jgi:hypothetical protein
MQQLNKKPSAAQDHNNYSLASSIDAPLEEDSKEEHSDNSNVSNNNVNRSSAPTTSIIKGEDKRAPPRALNITPQTRRDLTTISLCQLQWTWIEPAHPHGVVEDVDEDLLEGKPRKPPNLDIFPQELDKRTSHTSSVTNVARQATTPGTALPRRPLEVPQRI